MTSIALGLFILAVIYVAVWSIKNDGRRSIRDQNGIIRMRVPAQTPPCKAKRSNAVSSQMKSGQNPPGEEEPALPPAEAPPQRPPRPLASGQKPKRLA